MGHAGRHRTGLRTRQRSHGRTGSSPGPDGAAWREVEARIDGGDQSLFTPCYLALASEIRAVTSLPVLVDGFEMPDDEQLARQEGATLPDDALEGLDVLVSLQVDELRIAVVYQDATGRVWRSGRHGFEDPEPGLGRWADLGSRPVVLAGAMPLGAATVALRTGAHGGWHEPDVVNRGYWMCALNTKELNRTPEFIYRDAEGEAFTVEVSFSDSELPQLWPVQAPSTGRLRGYSARSNTVTSDTWHVDLSDVGPMPLETPSESSPRVSASIRHGSLRPQS